MNKKPWRVVQFNQMKSLFKSPKQMLETSWDSHFSQIPDIRKFICIVSENCSKITFFGSPSDITIDDDKWRFRSSNWAELGYSRLPYWFICFGVNDPVWRKYNKWSQSESSEGTSRGINQRKDERSYDPW
jgi:hypothetical protein